MMLKCVGPQCSVKSALLMLGAHSQGPLAQEQWEVAFLGREHPALTIYCDEFCSRPLRVRGVDLI